MSSKKIEYVVVDTNAFIKSTSFQDLADNVVTCQEVVNEVTSKRQIRRLVVLPFDLQIKNVDPENVLFVTEFSKKTGDYPSLSATDIKVIALTYQLEKEKVGSEHLKTAPEFQKSITFQNHSTVDLKDVAGFYCPTEKENKVIDESSGTGNNNVIDVPEDHLSDPLSEKLSALQCSSDSDQQDVGASSAENLSDCYKEEANVEAEDYDEQAFSSVDPSTFFIKVEESEESNDVRKNNSTNDDHASGEDVDDDGGDVDDEEDSDGDGGWITPCNIKQAKIQMNAEFEEEKSVKVACITSDFAMQNVLKQIGLNISSVDGRVIKQLRTFILRCYACFKTTSIMTKVFCPNCGHKTLKRVAVSVAPDGSQQIHINLKKPLTCKGKNIPVPLFKGGKHSNNPIIFADQPMPHQRPSRVARTKTNILDADYIPGYSPFALRDTTSKSAMLGIRGTQEIKRRMQTNPTMSRRKKK